MPDVELSLAEGAIAPWANGHSAEYFGRLLEGLASAMGFRMSTPWRRLPSDAQKAVLHGSDDQVHVRYRNRYGRERSYYAGYEGVVPFLERRHRPDRVRRAARAYEGYMRDVPCPVCKGARLKPEVLAVTLLHREQGERSIAEVSAMSVAECSEFLAGMELDARQTMIAGRHPQGGAGPARFPARRGAALPVAFARRGIAVRRRGAAHPAGHPDRLRPGRGALRARRAVDRPASARQPQAHPDPGPPARSGQHADRRRARRGHDPRGRLDGRHRAGRGRARRSHRAQRHRGGAGVARDVAHRRLPFRAALDPGARTSAGRSTGSGS